MEVGGSSLPGPPEPQDSTTVEQLHLPPRLSGELARDARVKDGELGLPGDL